MRIENTVSLRAHFVLWREQTGYTLREVEAMCGLSNAFLSQFESGKAGISFDNGMKLLQLVFPRKKP